MRGTLLKKEEWSYVVFSVGCRRCGAPIGHACDSLMPAPVEMIQRPKNTRVHADRIVEYNRQKATKPRQ